MDTGVHFSLVVSQQEQLVAPRLVAAEAVERFDSPRTSCSEVAGRLDVPDSTLRHWLRTRWRRMKHSQ